MTFLNSVASKEAVHFLMRYSNDQVKVLFFFLKAENNVYTLWVEAFVSWGLTNREREKRGGKKDQVGKYYHRFLFF